MSPRGGAALPLAPPLLLQLGYAEKVPVVANSEGEDRKERKEPIRTSTVALESHSCD